MGKEEGVKKRKNDKTSKTCFNRLLTLNPSWSEQVGVVRLPHVHVLNLGREEEVVHCLEEA